MKQKGPHGLNINLGFWDQLRTGAKCWCPHCGQQASFKKHKANASLVKFLSLLEAFSIEFGVGFYKSTDIIPRTGHPLQKISTDAISTARYMGLVLAKDDAKNAGGAPAGSYKILPLASAWLLGQQTVPEFVLAYNACVVGRANRQVMVSDAKGEPFNYAIDVEGVRADIQSGRITFNRPPSKP